MNKCLAKSNKSGAGGKATKRGFATRSGIRRLMRAVRRRLHKAMTLQKAKSIARHLGLTLREVCSGDYRVNFRDGTEVTAYYTDNLKDAVNTAVEMARKASVAKWTVWQQRTNVWLRVTNLARREKRPKSGKRQPTLIRCAMKPTTKIRFTELQIALVIRAYPNCNLDNLAELSFEFDQAGKIIDCIGTIKDGGNIDHNYAGSGLARLYETARRKFTTRQTGATILQFPNADSLPDMRARSYRQQRGHERIASGSQSTGGAIDHAGGHSALTAKASTNKSLAQVNKSTDVIRATKRRSTPQLVAPNQA
jgi:hypothetical protein